MTIVLPMNNNQYPNVFSKFKKLLAIVITAKLTMLITITLFFIFFILFHNLIHCQSSIYTRG